EAANDEALGRGDRGGGAVAFGQEPREGLDEHDRPQDEHDQPGHPQRRPVSQRTAHLPVGQPPGHQARYHAGRDGEEQRAARRGGSPAHVSPPTPYRSNIQTVCMEMVDPELHTDSTYGKRYGRGMTRTKHNLRSEAPPRRLVTAARAQFGARGFADVGTEEIVRAAGVTRGALYHQFRDKADLFAAVAEEVEAEIAERIADAAGAEADPMGALRSGARLFLDACA